MCSRYTFTSPLEAVIHLFDIAELPLTNLAPLPDIRPTDPAPIVRLNPKGRRELVSLRWWLVPRWAKQVKSQYTMFNAAGETLLERPAYREPFKHQRCLVPADGFFEWAPTGDKGKKVKYWIGLKDGGLFAMAGLWDRAEMVEGGPVESFTIITVSANPLVARYHAKGRMPAMLKRENFAAWLDPKTPIEQVQGLLTAYPEEEMAAKPA